MITAGMMALKDFPLAPDCFRALCGRVDVATLWIDREADKRIVAATIAAAPPSCRVKIIRSRAKWNRWNWREEMIRSLDGVRPDYVLAIDSDEMFGDGFDSDFSDFRASGKDLMLFGYEMATADGREVPRYPRASRCKAFRWRRGLSYQPYRGYAKPTLPGGAEAGPSRQISEVVQEHIYSRPRSNLLRPEESLAAGGMSSGESSSIRFSGVSTNDLAIRELRK